MIIKKYTEQAAIKLAESKQKEFKDWNTLTMAERDELFKAPEKYFVYVDVRLSQNDNTDLKGLPKFDGDDEAVIWKIPKWILYFANQVSDGLIFFDEINLAPPSILASAYQILHDRCMSETSLTTNLGIVCAGNRMQDRAHTFDMPEPLRDRLGEIELEFNTDAWFKWAHQKGLNSSLMAFLKFRPTYVYKVDFDGASKNITPRGIEITSDLLANTKTDILFDVVASRLGDAFAIEFEAFTKLTEKVDLNVILDKPETIENYQESDLRYSIMAGLSEIYKNNKSKFEGCIKVCEKVEPEYCILLMQLMKSAQPTNFKNSMMKSEAATELMKSHFLYFYD